MRRMLLRSEEGRRSFQLVVFLYKYFMRSGEYRSLYSQSPLENHAMGAIICWDKTIRRPIYS